MGEDRSVNELMRINENPTNYEPKEGDVIQFCNHIRIEVDHITPDGKVKIEDIPPGSDAAKIYPSGERPDPDPVRHPPLGIKTWASEGGIVSVEDLQRLLANGWELKLTR